MRKIKQQADLFIEKYNLPLDIKEWLVKFYAETLEHFRNKDGRPKKYATKEEAKIAKLEANRNYYQKNKEVLQEKRREKYKKS